jgi:hypothetical protein
MRLKADCVVELAQKFDEEIIPMVRKMKGFQDETTFATQSGTEPFPVSLWDRAESAEAYNRTIYPAVMNIVSESVKGTPQVETFDVTNSTFHQLLPSTSM